MLRQSYFSGFLINLHEIVNMLFNLVFLSMKIRNLKYFFPIFDKYGLPFALFLFEFILILQFNETAKITLNPLHSFFHLKLIKLWILHVRTIN